MLSEIIIRFVVGGTIVCLFSLIGEVLNPKSFAGIFGAAPSVALATLGLTFAKHGGSYVGLEGRSMVAGGIALFAYSVIAGAILMKKRMGTITAAAVTLVAWTVVAFGIWGIALR